MVADGKTHFCVFFLLDNMAVKPRPWEQLQCKMAGIAELGDGSAPCAASLSMVSLFCTFNILTHNWEPAVYKLLLHSTIYELTKNWGRVLFKKYYINKIKKMIKQAGNSKAKCWWSCYFNTFVKNCIKMYETKYKQKK